MDGIDWRHAFLRLSAAAAVKELEEPYLYHIGRDELYEIDNPALVFLKKCDGSRRGVELASDDEFVGYCLEEGLLELLADPAPVPVPIGSSATPSLRHLELQLTHRCNLRCRHCYLGKPHAADLPLADAVGIVREFAANGGLRLLISGGEPFLYPQLSEFLDATRGLGLRRVLLSNGTLITSAVASQLPVEEVQVSLDGWTQGHDLLRGAGSFNRTIAGIRVLREAGIPVGLATMVHRGNLEEFERLSRFSKEIGAVEWGVDTLCVAGQLLVNRELCISEAEAAPYMAYGFGGGYHGSSDGFACGRHLLTVLPTGQAVKCGFYADQTLGDARAGLMACWQRLRHIPLSELACHDCQVAEVCAGGCRFRARHPLGPDHVMCSLYGVEPPQAPLEHQTAAHVMPG